MDFKRLVEEHPTKKDCLHCVGDGIYGMYFGKPVLGFLIPPGNHPGLDFQICVKCYGTGVVKDVELSQTWSEDSE